MGRKEEIEKDKASMYDGGFEQTMQTGRHRPMVVGEPASQRLMRSIDTRRFNESAPTPNQVAMVLHALADHTAILEMLKHRPDETTPLQPPEATCVGRWFHDVGDDLEWL